MPRKKVISLPTFSFPHKMIELLFYVLFFFTPLILWPYTSEVFEFNKMLFVYLITTLIGFFWVLSWISEGKITIKRTILDIPILLFVATQVISTISSIDPHTSFWGYYSRFHGGLTSTLSYTLLFYALVTHLSPYVKESHPNTITNPKFLRIIYSILASSALVSIYAILEHFGIDKKFWVQDVQNRVFSTLGQPNWLSAYLIAILPLPIYLGIYSKKIRPSLLWYFLSFLIFISILYTKSRSGIGTTFIILALIALNTLKFKIKNLKFNRFLFVPCVLFLAIFLIGTPWTPNPKDISTALDKGGPVWVWGEKYLKKVGLTSVYKPIQVNNLTGKEKQQFEAESKGVRFGGSDSFDIRRLVWAGAIQLGKRHPFFGTGLETFGYTYYNVRPAEHNLNSEWDFLYNKAHNEYLNFLANAGFIGLGTYLILIVSIIYTFKSKVLNLTSSIYRYPLFLGFLSILITNYFGFSVVCVALFFFLFPALFIGISNHKDVYLSINLGINKWLLLFLLILLTGYSLITPINQFRADIVYNKGKVYLQYQQIKPAIDYLNKANDLNPNEPIFPALLAEAQASAVVAIKDQLDSLPATQSAKIKDQAQAMMDSYTQNAISNAKKAINLNKYNTLSYKSKAKVELYLGSIKPEYNNKALDTLLELSALMPTDAKIYYNIGLLYDQLGHTANAQLAYRHAVELKPDYQDPKRFIQK